MNTCPFCCKPYAYALPLTDNWYRPPLTQGWTITTITTITTNTTTNCNFTPMSPVDYCYGHTFVQCADCHCPVPFGYHTPESCALLRGFRQGIAELRASLTEPKRVDVPDVFQDAFKEVL